MGSSLLGWIVNEFDSFLDAAFKASLAGLKKLLFVLINLVEDIIGLFGTAGLVTVSQRTSAKSPANQLTPSSTGTEK